MHPSLLTSTIVLLLLFTSLLLADTLTGRVVKVVDGDTVNILDAGDKLHNLR